MTSTPNRAPALEPHKPAIPSLALVHAALDDRTLLALLLRRTDPDDDPERLAAALLDRFGSLGGVAGATPGELARASSAGPAVPADLKLLRELAIRLAREDACRRPVIASWTALLAYVRTALAHEPREQFRALYLDRRNSLLRDELVADESAYRPDALSPVGAGGLTQLMPGTALELGVRDRFDPVENLRGGADYLARQIRRFGDLRLALAAYNAGPARVARLGRVPDIAETQAYVATVVDCYLALTAGQGITSSTQCRPRGAER